MVHGHHGATRDHTARLLAGEEAVYVSWAGIMHEKLFELLEAMRSFTWLKGAGSGHEALDLIAAHAPATSSLART